MVYIVVVPFQSEPFCWVTKDEADTIEYMEMHYFCFSKEEPPKWSFDEWVAYEGRGVSEQHVFLTDADAVKGIDSITGYRAEEARQALRNQLAAHNVALA